MGGSNNIIGLIADYNENFQIRLINYISRNLISECWTFTKKYMIIVLFNKIFNFK